MPCIYVSVIKDDSDITQALITVLEIVVRHVTWKDAGGEGITFAQKHGLGTQTGTHQHGKRRTHGKQSKRFQFD
jgi:hypothetical protein